ncbi:MAG: class II fructose-bisphosphate aldolase [Abditibacteriota bacterium]|nr:class II fructose-bisphosphate aldolase [Abditibacteriota bacterium]
MIISDLSQVRAVYAAAAERGWLIPCFCSENLVTTEAIMEAAAAFAEKYGVKRMPVSIAITCAYSHRSQASYYTSTRDVKTGLELFYADIAALTEKGAPYEDLQALVHLDHIQHDLDKALTESDLSRYSSIMYDASTLPFEENIAKTAEFVRKKGGEIFIEGACDEIVEATENVKNDITTVEDAVRYMSETGVDMMVANLGTEHRASGKDLRYRGDRAREIKAAIGCKTVLHGASSVSNDQIGDLFSDGICKVNVWTALERDSAPDIFAALVKNAVKAAGRDAVKALIDEGYLTEKCLDTGDRINIACFTQAYRNGIMAKRIREMVTAYYELWLKA